MSCQPGDGLDHSLHDTTMMVHGKPQTYTEIVQVQDVDDVPAQLKNFNDQHAEPADKTCTQGCSISMVTGKNCCPLPMTCLIECSPSSEPACIAPAPSKAKQSGFGLGAQNQTRHGAVVLRAQRPGRHHPLRIRRPPAPRQPSHQP